MIALDAALRRLTVCQLTRESRGNGGGLRPRVWLRLRAAAGGNWTPDGILQLEGEANFSLSWGHEAHPKTTLYGVVFQKIEWAPAYVGTAIAAWVESGVAITATWWRTRSAAISGRRSSCPSAQQYSIATPWPSTKPVSLNPWRNAATKGICSSPSCSFGLLLRSHPWRREPRPK